MSAQTAARSPRALPRIVLRSPGGRVSVRLGLRALAVSCAIAATGASVFVAGLAYGEIPIAPGEVLATLVGTGAPGTDFIVLDLRLPRALVATFVGCALGLAGAIFQTLARNPLASPDIIGVSGGASLAGVSVFVLGASTAVLPLAGFAGALAASALIYTLAWHGGLSPFRLVLVGIGVAALTTAGTSYVLVQGRVEDIQQAYVWLVGSLNVRTYGDLWPLLAGLAVIVPTVVALARSIDALALDEDSARALGVRVERARLGLLIAAAALVGLAVAAAGPIAFVAFLAPQIARALVRAPGAASLPAAALCGATLVLTGDLVGRSLAAPSELPVGIVTSILGAPFFLYLLVRTTRAPAAA